MSEQEQYDYGMLDKQAPGTSAGYLRHPPVRKIIEDQIADLKKQIEVREQLIVKLDASKKVEEILDLLRKIYETSR